MLNNEVLGDPAPFYSDVARTQVEVQGHWCVSDDGVRVRCISALPSVSEAKGTVLLFSGRTEYAEKYGPIIDDIVARGYACASVDWRGQGLSDRPLSERNIGHVEHFLDYQKDVQTLLNYAQAQNLPEPYFLLAHSMGGAIGLRALYQGLPVKAAAFSAPMWDIHIEPRPYRIVGQMLLKTLCAIGQRHKLAPSQRTSFYVQTRSFEGNALTYDSDVWKFFNDQVEAYPELGLGGVSNGWMLEALREARELMALEPLDVPIFTLLGSEETVVSPSIIRTRMEHWPNGKLQLIEKARHEILLERLDVRRAAMNDIFKHFSSVC